MRAQKGREIFIKFPEKRKNTEYNKSGGAKKENLDFARNSQSIISGAF